LSKVSGSDPSFSQSTVEFGVGATNAGANANHDGDGERVKLVLTVNDFSLDV